MSLRADYGGMDVYTVNLGGKYHDDVSRPPFLVLYILSFHFFDLSSVSPI